MPDIAKVVVISGVLILMGQFPVLAAPCACAEQIANCEAFIALKDKHLVFTSPADEDCVVVTYEIDGEQSRVTFKGGKDDSTEYLSPIPSPNLGWTTA